jgi:hypothetical protein
MTDCAEWACSYMVFFSLSLLFSAISMSVTLRILASSLRKRLRPNVGSGKQVQAKSVQGNGNDLSHNKSVDELHAELEDNKYARWRQYCTVLLAVFEVRLVDETMTVCSTSLRKPGAMPLSQRV